ncbi:MAG: polyprenyl synthetase [Deltaproteobacteria bacterium]|nr:polyprenyl synthetase [Deltaproteobacteria bacterium]
MSAKDVVLRGLISPIKSLMEETQVVLEREITDPSPAAQDMLNHISRFRGKQMRGALLLLAGEATGATSDEHPTMAAVIEMIHLATLVHDDVLDGAEVRRRVACVNQRWDNQVAVLLGDFLYTRAFGLSLTLKNPYCSCVLSETSRKICIGEIEQSTMRYHFDLKQEDYERIAGAKTACLISAACELGARYPEAGYSEERDRFGDDMAAYGWAVGLAFQIVDDCLDLEGDPEKVGKSVGTDAEDGKVTLPILCSYWDSDEATRRAIREVYTKPDLDKRAVRLHDVCDVSRGVEFAMARARELVDSAAARVKELPESAARDALVDIGDYVLERRW